MQHRFFALISRMRYIGRWGLMRNTFEENIHNTTVLCCAVVDCDPFSCNDGGYSRLLRADRS